MPKVNWREGEVVRLTAYRSLYGQSKLESFVEAAVGTVVGFVINMAVQVTVLPVMLGIEISLVTNFQVAALFTCVSVARGYVIRRWFNRHLNTAVQSIVNRVNRWQ